MWGTRSEPQRIRLLFRSHLPPCYGLVLVEVEVVGGLSFNLSAPQKTGRTSAVAAVVVVAVGGIIIIAPPRFVWTAAICLASRLVTVVVALTAQYVLAASYFKPRGNSPKI